MAAKKPYAIKYSAPDGKSVVKFATLAEAGKYLAERTQGADYMRGMDHMGTDYANYYTVGFDLTDVGKFSYPDGYREYGFYDWAGGSVVDIGKGDFHVVEFVDCGEYPTVDHVVSAHESLEAAMADGSKKAEAAQAEGVVWYQVHKDGKSLGYIDSDSFEWVEKTVAAPVVPASGSGDDSNIPF